MPSGSTHPSSALDHRVSRESGESSWVPLAITASAGFFIFLLLLSMFFDPSVRVLHPLQALIYVAVIYLTRRNSAWGFGAGCLIAAFWNYIFLTGAARDIWAFLTGRTANIFIPLQLAAVVAHLVLITACIIGFLSLRPDAKRWARFLGGGVIAICVLVLLVDILRPQSMILLRRSFGL